MATFMRSLCRFYSSQNLHDFGAAGRPCPRPFLYQVLSLGVALPAVAILSYKVLTGRHDEEEEEEEKPYIPYEYLNIRTKKFPWGDGNTPFFYNPSKNHLPGEGEDYAGSFDWDSYDFGSMDSDAGSMDSDAGSMDSDAGSMDSDAGSMDSDKGSKGSATSSTESMESTDSSD